MLQAMMSLTSVCGWTVCAACVTPAFRRGKGLWQKSPSTGLCGHYCHGSIWFPVWCAGNHVCFPVLLTDEQGKKNSLFSSLTAKADERWGKRGCCVWEDWRKRTHFLFLLWLSANGGKGRILAVEHILGPVNCSWGIWVAHCSSAKQLRGQICLILSCWKLNQASPCPFVCSPRELWVRESHEPCVCTLTSPGLHRFTRSCSPSPVFVPFSRRGFVTSPHGLLAPSVHGHWQLGCSLGHCFIF